MAPEGIVILGVPRSGTTLLSRVLGAHPDVACPPETFLLTACGRFLREYPLPDGLTVGVRSGLAFVGVDRDHLVDELREFALQFPRQFARDHGKKLWAEKTPFDVFYLDEIWSLLGARVRYVCIQRHGLDVAGSMKDYAEEIGAYLPEIHEYTRIHHEPIRAFAALWADRATALHTFAQRHPHSAVSIRYEDFVAAPESALAALLDSLGLAPAPDLAAESLRSQPSLGFGDWNAMSSGKIRNSSVARWQKLPKPVVGRLAPVVNEALEMLGYEPVQGNVPNPVDAARHYEMRLALLAAKARAHHEESGGDGDC